MPGRTAERLHIELFVLLNQLEKLKAAREDLMKATAEASVDMVTSFKALAGSLDPQITALERRVTLLQEQLRKAEDA